MSPSRGRLDIALWLMRLLFSACTAGSCFLAWLALGQCRLECAAPRVAGELECVIVNQYPGGIVRRAPIAVREVSVERIHSGGYRSPSVDEDMLVLNSARADRKVLRGGDVGELMRTLDDWRFGRKQAAAPLVLALADANVFMSVLMALIAALLLFATLVFFSLQPPSKARRPRRR
jgi:hypothetical protein